MLLSVSVIRVDHVMDILEYPGNAHHNEQLAVENHLLLHVAVDSDRVIIGVLRGSRYSLCSVSRVPSFLGCQI